MGREISGSSTNMQKTAGHSASRTRELYTEGYVQSAAYGVESLLKQIKALAGTLSSDLDRKAAALIWGGRSVSAGREAVYHQAGADSCQKAECARYFSEQRLSRSLQNGSFGIAGGG